MPLDTKGYRALENTETAFRLDDSAGCWLVEGSIHMKVVSGLRDPVELTSKEAKLLAQALLEFARVLDEDLETVPPGG